MRAKLMKILGIMMILSLMSCSDRLIGTWNITDYETKNPEKEGAILQNIGQITFNDDNTGKNFLNYEVFGEAKDDTITFSWLKTKGYITIESENEAFAKTWIIMENKRKSQVWKTTSGRGDVQVLKLAR